MVISLFIFLIRRKKLISEMCTIMCCWLKNFVVRKVHKSHNRRQVYTSIDLAFYFNITKMI